MFTCGVRRAPQPACPGSLPTLYALLWLVGASDEAQGLGCRLSPVGARGAPAAPASELAKLHNPRLSRRSPFAIAWPANALGPPPPAEIGLPPISRQKCSCRLPRDTTRPPASLSFFCLYQMHRRKLHNPRLSRCSPPQQPWPPPPSEIGPAHIFPAAMLLSA